MLRDTIGQLYFNRTLNNYQLIKAHFNRERLPEDYSKVVTRGETGSNLCVKMEYRIEVTLSSHKAKKVQINIVRCSDRSYCWCLLWRMMKLGASMWMSLSSRKLGSMWRWVSGISIRSSPKVDIGHCMLILIGISDISYMISVEAHEQVLQAPGRLFSPVLHDSTIYLACDNGEIFRLAATSQP